ncbi:Rne/Rng family ribonuclease [Actibacterium sp. 188UL27-1]|uniref:Rne/Rng family ribonuclease n=1 Tax=Actibacterium sp. 188UL27-1 TaxID=2786961 RepID=UPI00195EA926|nr:Rne/Rng family ribonuclease [Actibacterium sp. 188UL27-1]MBM7067894.1 Rne/Rng family ribonuclease [Actibacterium sp. 188UL27-1]
MPKKMLIDATHAEETRVVVVDGNKVDEFDFETVNRRQLAGNIYLAKVTRVEPSLQAAFVDYGGNRHGFLAFSEIHPDYYQIPVADREALLAEERAYAKEAEEDEPEKKPARKRRSTKAAKSADKDAVETRDVASSESGGISGMDVVDLDDDTDNDDPVAPIEVAEDGAPAAADDETKPEAAAAETEAAPETEAEIQEPAPEEGTDAVAESDTATADADLVVAEGPASTDTPPGEDDDADAQVLDASERDESIESVADEDVTEEIRPRRKPRVRRYKIQEVIKVRQILLVQVVKEERGNKGAALTTYLSLAGRYCVLMPNTARGGGISRKITNAADRKKLKDIAGEIDVPEGAGLIVRTAGAKRTKTEIKRDYEYLQRLWEQIRELTLKSMAPAPIYEEGDLIKRSIRDLYNRDIDEVLVEGDKGYRTAKDFMKMIMPSHAKNVKQYQDPMPLFARHQVESYLSGMFNPTVQLKSGGYIVIGVTEALVAIDVNSGRATKEGSIEETATKTNMEAAEEVARQLRLRDLAGLIVIDFIDMEDRRNNAKVEKLFKDKLKTDRARIQVGRISGFGLMEMSRQRLRPGMLESTTQPCPHCHGTGLLRSDDSLGLTILRQLEEEGTRQKTREALVKAPVGICNFLMNQKRDHVAQIEARYGLSVRIEADPHLISPDFSIEKFKTATRVVVATAPVISIDTSDMPDVEEEVEDQAAPEAATEAADEGDQPKKRRRRRRRRRGGSGNGADAETQANDDTQDAADGDANKPAAEAEDAPADAGGPTEAAPEPVADAETSAEDAEKPAKKPRRRTRAKKTEDKPEVVEGEATAGEEAPAPKKRTRTRKRKTEAEATESTPAEPAPTKATPTSVEAPEVEAEQPAPEVVAEVADVKQPEPMAEAVVSEPALASAPVEVAVVPEPEKPAKPKRKGWWSLGR